MQTPGKEREHGTSLPLVFVLLLKLVLEVMLNEILGWEKKSLLPFRAKESPCQG